MYHSLDEVPPEFREKFEKLQSEATQKLEAGLQAGEVLKDAPAGAFIVHKELREFRIKGASGKEQVYHSLDEMPPETRAIFEKATSRLKLPGQTNLTTD